MSATIAGAVLGVSMLLNVAGTDIDKTYNNVDKWEPIGKCRITCYCPRCNDGAEHESSSGAYLEYGHAACNWLPIGTVISVEGEEFTVVDTCGTDAIDIFIDDESGCHCNLNEYRYVSIKR